MFGLIDSPHALVIGKQNPLFGVVLPQYLILGAEIVDDELLLAVDPASQDQEVELPRSQNEVHESPDANRRGNQTASGRVRGKSSGRDRRR